MLQQPWRLPVLVARLATSWAGLARDAHRVRRQAGHVDAVLVGYLGHFDVLLARVLFPRTTIVLDHLVFAGDTAADRGARGIRVRMLKWLDRMALRCCDVAVVDTDEHLAMLPDPAKGIVVPVGAPASWFDAGRDDGSTRTPPDPALKVVFFGLYTPLQGSVVVAHALAHLMERRGGIHATMIGSGQDVAAARAVLADRTFADDSTVTWTDWVEPRELPAIVADHDVCLGIFGGTAKARRVVPNKVYQGIAAGCAVVTSDTPPQRRAVGDLALLVAPDDPDALTATLAALADDPAMLHDVRARSRSGARRFGAREIVGPLAERLGVGA
jgi:glycosyltransferase involved in cell wall biosynthesis